MAIKRITVLLADDHEVVREGFRSLLGHESDIEVVGEAATGRQAVTLTGQLHPAVVVMDIAMPVLNGLEATRQIRRDFPGTKVLILSAHSDEAYVEQASALGAAGFLLKQTSAHILAQAIREVGEGKVFFSAALSKFGPGDSAKAPVRPGKQAPGRDLWQRPKKGDQRKATRERRQDEVSGAGRQGGGDGESREKKRPATRRLAARQTSGAPVEKLTILVDRE